jgi:hypothetical protein
METVANFFAVIFMIALIIVVAPQLFELLAFLFVIFLQIMVGYSEEVCNGFHDSLL